MTTKMTIIIYIIITHYLHRIAPRGEHLGHNMYTGTIMAILIALYEITKLIKAMHFQIISPAAKWPYPAKACFGVIMNFYG